MDDATQSAKLRTVAKGLHEIGLSGIFGDVANKQQKTLRDRCGLHARGERAADEREQTEDDQTDGCSRSSCSMNSRSERSIRPTPATAACRLAQRIVAEHEIGPLALLKGAAEIRASAGRRARDHRAKEVPETISPCRSCWPIMLARNIVLTDLRRKYTEEIAKAEIEVQHAATLELSAGANGSPRDSAVVTAPRGGECVSVRTSLSRTSGCGSSRTGIRSKANNRSGDPGIETISARPLF